VTSPALWSRRSEKVIARCSFRCRFIERRTRKRCSPPSSETDTWRLGRWPSPDPAGIASVDPTDPQTWNRYAYVRNSPLMMTDPTGLDGCLEYYGNEWTSVPCDISYTLQYFGYGEMGYFVMGGFYPSTGGGGGSASVSGKQPQTQTCTVSNGRTTAPGPGQAPGPGAFGLYPSQHPGMVAIDPMALGLFPGSQTNALLRSNLSQITFNFSPTPRLPGGFPTTFTVGDIAGGNPSPRVGGSAFNGLYDFDIYGLPSDAAASAATSPRGVPVSVTVTFPSSLPINCGGPATDPILPPPGEVPAFRGVVRW
jgi:hypothetical protein